MITLSRASRAVRTLFSVTIVGFMLPVAEMVVITDVFVRSPKEHCNKRSNFDSLETIKTDKTRWQV